MPVHRNHSHAIHIILFFERIQFPRMYIVHCLKLYVQCTVYSSNYKTTENGNKEKVERIFIQWNRFVYRQPPTYISLFLSILKSFWEMI